MEAKVVYVPLQDEGDDRTRFVRLGVRVQLPNAHRWFYCYRFQTWTRTVPGYPLTYKSGSPMLDRKGLPILSEEKKHGPYRGDEGLRTTFAHCPALVDVLIAARELAEAEDEAKRQR